MQMRYANRDQFAWEKGEQAFVPGDTFEIGVAKAEEAGLRPGCNGYSAFITAFSRRVRQHQKDARLQGDVFKQPLSAQPREDARAV